MNKQNAMGSPTSQLTPFKQSLVRRFQKPLELLKKKNAKVSISFSNGKLNQDMSLLLGNLGFSIHTTTVQHTENLLKHIPYWLYNDNIVLLHYRPESGDASLLNLLRAVKQHSSKLSFENLVPVFFVSVSPKKQIEIFRSLGVFGIQYVIFVTPNVPLETNLEELLSELASLATDYRSRKLAAMKVEIEADASEPDVMKLKQYNELLETANSCMENQDYDRAIELFTQAIELKPDSEALVRRGDAYFRHRNYLLALNDYQAAAKLEQKMSEPFAKISSCCFVLLKRHLNNGDEEEAKKKLELGMDCLRKAKEKVEEFLNANKTAPEKIPPAPYSSIIESLIIADLHGMGFQEEEEEITQITRNVLEATKEDDYLDSPFDANLPFNYALLLTRSNQPDKAERVLRSLIARDPGQKIPILNNFAVELRKRGHHGKAFVIYTELLGCDMPDHSILIESQKNAGLKYGQELRDNFNMLEAIEVYKSILQFRPMGREWVLCELAMAYLELQDQAQASSRLMEAVYINPSLMQSKNFIAYQDLCNLRTEMLKKLTEVLGSK